MIKRIVGTLVGLAGVGAGVLAASFVVLGNRRIDEWETLTIDDAVEGDYVELDDGTRLHYITCGDPANEPIILIHGLMDSALHWHKNIAALAEHHRVFAIDLPGFGYSSRVNEPVYCLDYLARAVHDFMNEREIWRADIAGHSLGGAVALQMAHDYPERVDKLVLIAPGTYLTNQLEPLKYAARVPYAPRAIMGFAMTSEQARIRSWQHALGSPEHLDRNELSLRVRPQRVKGTADALIAMAASCWTNNLANELDRVTAPTLILWGDRDRTVPPWHGDRHINALPKAELIVLEGAGHIPQNEFPERVNELMLGFLTNQTQGLSTA
ncbi:MAG: alpha/beta fold hydrolase [Chloroflexi bacterium]|nr:alpha/beta fold hydrolase [Chloroflexota bacterium]